MALRVVSMEELKLEVLLEPERTGDSVAEVCRRRGISRTAYYRYRRRYLELGREGLEPRSRRPLSSPAQIPAGLEEELCRLRSGHPRWGARRLRAELARAGLEPPAVSTIHQALRRNGLVAPRPPRRANATKRFERAAPNDLWQIDATQVDLASGDEGWVVDVLDDHARFLLFALGCPSPTSEAVWRCFSQAAADYGLPRQLLSDNHASFTGRLLGFEAAFERKLAEVGVELINARPAHPQTLGKLERFHRTLKEWLAEQGPAEDLEGLQLLLERFRTHYNEERPHQGIGDLTPVERYRLGAPAASLGELALSEDEKRPPYPAHAALRKVWGSGVVTYDKLAIVLGRRFAGATVRIVEVGNLIHVYLGDELLRAVAPDRTKRYQGLGRRTRGRW